MERILYLLIFIIIFPALTHAQCVPDASLDGEPLGLYPAALSDEEIAQGLVTAQACKGENLNVVFTLVFDNMVFGSIIDSIRMDNVTGLPSGITFDAPFFTISEPGLACFVLTGTPAASVEARNYEITFKASAWLNGSTTPSNVDFPGTLVQGKYILKVQEAAACCELSLEATNNAAVCSTTNNGEAGVVASGAIGDVSYQWDAKTGNQTTQVATGLAPGTYSVTVSDQGGCVATTSTTVGLRLNAVDFNITVDNDAGCAGGGQATITTTAGRTPFTYLWDNGETTQTATNLSEGEHSATVTDNTGCANSKKILIQGGGNSLAVSLSSTSPSCVGDNDGAAEVTITGGNQGATFEWSNGQTNAQATGLAAGEYTVTISKDECSTTESVTVSAPVPVSVNTNFQSENGCTGGLPSSVIAVGSGGSGVFSYAWSDGTNGATLTPTMAGSYSVTATDSKGCDATTTISLSGEMKEPITATITGTDVTCNANADGTATISASGGDGNLQYLWSNGATTPSISNLTIGSYQVTVSDNSGCSVETSITIGKEQTFTLSAAVNDVNCNGTNDGSISLTPSRGNISDFTFNWQNGATTSSLSNLSAGTYRTTVTETITGCIVTGQYTIQESNPLNITTTSATDVLCNGQATGTASIAVSGGTGQLSYQWSNGSVTATINGLRARSYSVTVTDAAGCSVQQAVVIGEPAPIEVNAEATDETLGNDGTATANPTGGIPPYTYIWSQSNNSNFNRVSRTIDNLTAGAYTVTILDDNGCTSTQTVIVGASNCGTLLIDFDAEIPSCDTADGSLSANPSGGTPPYQYLWSNGANTQTIENLSAGEYQVTITDQDGCPAISSFTLDNPSDFSINFINRRQISCFNTSDGAITASVVGGGNYTYNWSTGATSARIENLMAGTYTVTATNSSGCEVVDDFTINAPDTLIARLAAKANISCAGEMDGMASIVTEGGTTPYEFAWSNGTTTSQISNLSAGEYLVSVTDANQCAVATSVTITAPDSLRGDIQTTDTSCPNVNNGMATADITGGTGNYTYIWSTGGSESSEINIPKGNHTLTITDENSCNLTIPFSINEPDSIFLALSATGETTPNADDGTATVIVTGGVPPYQYEWDNGSTNATATNLSPGMRIVTVIDDNGCAAVGTVRVNEAGCTISINATGTDAQCNGGNSGSATVEVSDNISSELTFAWSNTAATQTITSLVAGTYSVTVVETNGCEATTSVTINQPPAIIIGIAQQEDVDCDGTLGSIAATASGGTGNLNYLWSNGENTLVIDNLTADTYTLTVTDQNTCEVTRSVEIKAATSLEVETNTTNILCAGENTGMASIQVNGATGNLSYNWSGGISNTNMAQNLAAGTYQVTVTENGGCESVVDFEITEPSAIQIALNTTKESVAGANNGTAAAMVTGGAGMYQYDFGNEQSDSPSASNLAPGDYTLTVTDANGCTQTSNFTIEAADVSCTTFDIEVATQNISCANNNDGSAQVQRVDGDGPFTYFWSTNDTTQVISNLSAGEYIVTVTDGFGCPSTQSFAISAPSPVEATVTTQNVDCATATNGVASIDVSGGTAPYSFNWPDGGSNERERNDLSSGSYTVTITDANGCILIENFSIDVIADSVPPTASANNVTLYLDEFGTARVSADVVNNGSEDECGEVTASLSKERFNCEDLGENEIVLQVRDDSGNTDSVTATITVLDTIAPFINCLEQDIVITDCEADRSITFLTPEAFDNCGSALTPTLESGLPSGSVFPPGVTEQVFVVEDASGNQSKCSFMVNFQILDINLEVDEPSCTSFADGSISASVNNSSGTVFYSWSNNVQTRTNTGLEAGTYTLTVVDGQGCTQIETITLQEPDPLEINIVSFVNPIEGETTGSIDANISGGVSPYDYQWVKIVDNGTDIVGTEEDIENLGIGSYRLSVVDDNECFATSDLISLEPNSANNTLVDYEVAIRPNPTGGSLFLEIQQDKARSYNVELFNMTGRWLETLTVDGTANTQTYDLSKYSNGIYFVKIQVEHQVLIKRLVILQE